MAADKQRAEWLEPGAIKPLARSRHGARLGQPEPKRQIPSTA